MREYEQFLFKSLKYGLEIPKSMKKTQLQDCTKLSANSQRAMNHSSMKREARSTKMSSLQGIVRPPIG